MVQYKRQCYVLLSSADGGKSRTSVDVVWWNSPDGSTMGEVAVYNCRLVVQMNQNVSISVIYSLEKKKALAKKDISHSSLSKHKQTAKVMLCDIWSLTHWFPHIFAPSNVLSRQTVIPLFPSLSNLKDALQIINKWHSTVKYHIIRDSSVPNRSSLLSSPWNMASAQHWHFGPAR